MKYDSITITGPTASGKTGKAIVLASYLGGEIISADSRQVYTGMDLGTGKDLEEYGNIPYHLIDILPAGQKYNLHRFNNDFHKAYAQIISRNKIPIICGGTGMYLENVLSGIKLPEVPENPGLRKHLEKKSLDELRVILSSMKTLHNSTDVDTAKRAVRAIEIEEFYNSNPDLAELTKRNTSRPLNSLIIALDIPREERRKRITDRLHARLKAGMIEEVRTLLASGIKSDDLIYYGLEYKYLTLYAIGKISYDEMIGKLNIAIHQFAKRQMTWFRGMEKRGFKLNWIPFNLSDKDFIDKVEKLYC